MHDMWDMNYENLCVAFVLWTKAIFSIFHKNRVFDFANSKSVMKIHHILSYLIGVIVNASSEDSG